MAVPFGHRIFVLRVGLLSYCQFGPEMGPDDSWAKPVLCPGSAFCLAEYRVIFAVLSVASGGSVQLVDGPPLWELQMLRHDHSGLL